MTESEIRNLLDRYQQGLCTPQEKQKIDRWFESESDAPEAFKNETERLKIKSVLRESIYHRVGLTEKSQLSIAAEDSTPYKTSTQRVSFESRFRIVYRIAASFLLLAVVGYGAFRYLKPIEIATVVAQDIKAGGDKAILKLADGTMVELNGKGTSIPQQGVAQIVNASGKLSYQATDATTEILYNTVTTPRGGQYQLTLSDGSMVWLNAASSIKFPAVFSGSERVVEITGEAYFEVAHNKAMPFKVHIPSGAEVEVLGTHFNVMAYAEENEIKTTLIEGSVRITKGAQSSLLSPNQQAQISKDGNVTVANVNVSQAVAWKNNKFIFRNTALPEIMRQVARWYNVEVVYEDSVHSLRFGGVVSRKENASAVLGVLELTGSVKFEMKGNKIIVKSTDKK